MRAIRAYEHIMAVTASTDFASDWHWGKQSNNNRNHVMWSSCVFHRSRRAISSTSRHLPALQTRRRPAATGMEIRRPVQAEANDTVIIIMGIDLFDRSAWGYGLFSACQQPAAIVPRLPWFGVPSHSLRSASQTLTHCLSVRSNARQSVYDRALMSLRARKIR
ncbi:hypothetical protein ZHAS_00016529 [Anopheles sinensis]|uniref:Uncharacterized protein n=1 Tax=Anopheles sinensis TaxID=74873 RepID=A0A084WDW1_ANOSI|nr:hypothetical protein ZHAS_00016529 [Anopheles sinensis]